MNVNKGPRNASGVPRPWDAYSWVGCCTAAGLVIGLGGSGSWLL